MARRLLVISYHYPSDSEVGGLRWAALTKHLSREGWEAWFLTAAPAVSSRTPGVTVESCAAGRTASDLYRSVRRAAPAVPLPPNRADLAASRRGVRAALLRPLAALRSEASGLLYLLSEGRGWTLRAARRARALIDRVRPDVVVSSGPPHAPHLAAWLATRGRAGVRWVVDLRDPWAGPVAKAWEKDHAGGGRIGAALTRAAERLVLRSASAVFTTTQELAAALSAQYPRAAIAWVPNGADAEALPRPSADPFPGLAIAHLGTLYGGRDAGPLLRALRLFLDRCPEARRDGTMFRNAGQEEPTHAAATRRTVADLGLGDHVALHRPLPRAQALELLARSKLAVVLAQDQDYQVPSKLYESVAMGIPTLVVAARDSATGREAVRVGAVVAEPDDLEGLATMLAELWAGAGGVPATRAGVCDYRTLAPTVAALLNGESLA
ncbi:MAG: glycosyltransferase [Gemmatimonadales bacterium]